MRFERNSNLMHLNYIGNNYMKILYYILKRVILLIPVLLGISLITFFVSRVLPGNPVHLMLGGQPTQEMIDQLTKDLGLDLPVWHQYLIYLGDVLKGDFGTAWHTNNPVLYDLKIRFSATFELILVSLIMALFVSIPLGVFAAINRNKLIDHLTRGISLLGVTIPPFWLGLLLIFFFYYKLGIFPAAMGRLPLGVSIPDNGTGLILVDSLLRADIRLFWLAFKQIFLPAFTLGFVSLAPLTRLVRSSMIEVLNTDYINTHRATGISEFLINFKYALKNALLPAITMLGTMFGYMLGGVVLIEKVFSWPGVGLYAVDSIQLMDYSAVQGFVMLSAIFYVSIFLIVDLIYFALDPRIKY